YNNWRWDHWRRVKATDRVLVPGSGRVVEGAWEPEGRIRFAQACNIPIQGLCADAMLRAIRLVFQRLRGLQAGLVACVHDELVVEAAEDHAEQARAILQGAMIEAFQITFPGAPSGGVAEARIGWKRFRPATFRIHDDRSRSIAGFD